VEQFENGSYTSGFKDPSNSASKRVVVCTVVTVEIISAYSLFYHIIRESKYQQLKNKSNYLYQKLHGLDLSKRF